jgi:hypothetical protein
VQVQQLLSCGTAKTSQALVGFREIVRLARRAHAAFDAHDGASRKLANSLLALATSPSGINRRMERQAFVGGCAALVESIGEVVSGSDGVLAGLEGPTFWWEPSEHGSPWEPALNHAHALPEACRAAVDSFFACAPSTHTL